MKIRPASEWASRVVASFDTLAAKEYAERVFAECQTDALEAAARVADEWSTGRVTGNGALIASMIRALMPEGGKR